MNKFDIGTKVNVKLSGDEMTKLGIAGVENPCTVTGHFTNGTEGHYLTTSAKRTIAVADRYEALSAV